jgi:hypothetical protein
MVNLLCQTHSAEESLTQGLRKLLDESQPALSKENKKIDYDHFDFNYHCKKGTAILDTYINDMLKN